MHEDRRILEHPLLGTLPKRQRIIFTLGGRPAEGSEGDTIASALWAAGIRGLGSAPPRGIFCGIGHCFSCTVVVDGVHGVRACLVPIRAEMKVEIEPE